MDIKIAVAVLIALVISYMVYVSYQKKEEPYTPSPSQKTVRFSTPIATYASNEGNNSSASSLLTTSLADETPFNPNMMVSSAGDWQSVNGDDRYIMQQSPINVRQGFHGSSNVADKSRYPDPTFKL
jgi:hypothetical protein